ncbi:hypothetical protein GCM10022220_19120 [Actinocatenispora rupis]|uniref:Uncharacterized protein n=1 Tax=Actinocatenispora rupis TaxID=519421 RepID=A0A8J3IY26_9ACTN|nr:hypothetical protein Aru02nite_17640 [Actinocatenispora rupis]
MPSAVTAMSNRKSCIHCVAPEYVLPVQDVVTVRAVASGTGAAVPRSMAALAGWPGSLRNAAARPVAIAAFRPYVRAWRRVRPPGGRGGLGADSDTTTPPLRV